MQKTPATVEAINNNCENSIIKKIPCIVCMHGHKKYSYVEIKSHNGSKFRCYIFVVLTSPRVLKWKNHHMNARNRARKSNAENKKSQ